MLYFDETARTLLHVQTNMLVALTNISTILVNTVVSLGDHLSGQKSQDTIKRLGICLDESLKIQKVLSNQLSVINKLLHSAEEDKNGRDIPS